LRVASSENKPVEDKTKLLYGSEDVVGRGVQFIQNVKVGMDLFGDKNGPSIIIGYDIYKNNYIDVVKRGGKIRLITEITKDNIQYCKDLVNIVTELRHLDGLIGGIAVSESEYMSTHVLREKQLLTQAFYSNAEDIVKQGQYIFNTFWAKAVPAVERIKEIEEGIKPDFIETIREPARIQELGFQMVKSAKEEILIIFSTANAFHRQERAGMVGLLETIAKRGVKIRVLRHSDINIAKQLEQENAHGSEVVTVMQIRFLETQLHTRASILIVDKHLSLSVELKNDEKRTSSQAIGLASYSNSKATVLSYVSFFETLWMQAGLYEKLKLHDRTQKEFIDVAAHELRTPIQPILGLSDILLSKKGNIEEYRELLEAINRNSKRLQMLTNDILDVTRIESQSLQLRKEKINLNEVILGVISEYKDQIRKQSTNLNLNLVADGAIFVDADRLRLRQVFDNILSNAIKFTIARPDESDKNNKSTITIILQRNKKHKEKDKHYQEITNNDYEAIVSIKDTGTGIHSEIFPRLFTKFATKSDRGTGLGLFICKSIVEAHGGRIWAENNKSDTEGNKGAIFYFTIPIKHSLIK
jgi:two-component system, OmpR family, sensor histidine kinase VicK